MNNKEFTVARPRGNLYKIPIKDILGLRNSNYDSTLAYGEVIHDYLKAK